MLEQGADTRVNRREEQLDQKGCMCRRGIFFVRAWNSGEIWGNCSMGSLREHRVFVALVSHGEKNHWGEAKATKMGWSGKLFNRAWGMEHSELGEQGLKS